MSLLITIIALAWSLCSTAPVSHAQVQNAPEAGYSGLTLDDCIQTALERNYDLRIARTNLAASMTTKSEALAIYWPTLTATAEYTDWRLFGERGRPVGQNVEYDPIETMEKRRGGLATLSSQLPLGTLLDLSYFQEHFKLDPDRSDLPEQTWIFSITQPLLRGGGWTSGTGGVQDADFEIALAAADLRSAELNVIETVKAAYYEVIRQAKLVDVTQKAIERDEQLLLQSQTKVEAGLATRRDQLSAEIILAQDRGKKADAETAHREALDALALAMGLEIGTTVELAEQDVELEPVEIQEESWLQKAQRDNPNVLSARLSVERQDLAKRLAGNARLPQLDLNFTYTNFDDPDLSELDKEENILRVLSGDLPQELDPTAFKGWSTFLTLSYPLGNKGPGSVYRRTQRLHELAQQAFTDVTRQTSVQVRSAIRELQNSLVNLEILDKEIEGAKNKLEFASINFQLGRASNLDVTEAQKDLLDAETDYVNQVVDYLTALARIEALIGGF